MSNQPVEGPTGMDEIAAAHCLGHSVAEDRSGPGGSIGTVLGSLVFGVVMIIVGINISVVILVFGVVVVIFGVLVWWATRNPGEVLLLGLYEHGLVLIWTGHENVVLRWADVDELTTANTKITNGVTSTTMHKMTIRGGRHIVVLDDRLESVEATTKQVTELVAAAMLPRMSARINVGMPVDFGQFTIHRDWIDNDGRRLSWSEVSRIQVKNGEVRILKHGGREPWAKVYAAAGFPNFVMFLTLAEALRTRSQHT